jgi:hypothetical protein
MPFEICGIYRLDCIRFATDERIFFICYRLHDIENIWNNSNVDLGSNTRRPGSTYTIHFKD